MGRPQERTPSDFENTLPIMPDQKHASTLPRFQGDSGLQRLAEVLKQQTLIAGNDQLAHQIIKVAQLMEVLPGAPGDTFIDQGGTDNDIFFIISGSVSVLINGREIGIQCCGTHVGEMALIDPTARRCATVKASEPCVLARVSQGDFSQLAGTHTNLWRNIAVELAKRLRDRSRFIRQPHNQPVVFIGSSREHLDVARGIHSGFSNDPIVVIVVNVWTDGVFRPSLTSIENLVLNQAHPPIRTGARGLDRLRFRRAHAFFLPGVRNMPVFAWPDRQQGHYFLDEGAPPPRPPLLDSSTRAATPAVACGYCL